VNATVTQCTSSVNRVSLPTDQTHGRVTVYRRTVRSPLTGCHVISRPHDRLSRYSQWPDTFRTALVQFSQISVTVHHSAWRNVTKDLTLHKHHLEASNLELFLKWTYKWQLICNTELKLEIQSCSSVFSRLNFSDCCMITTQKTCTLPQSVFLCFPWSHNKHWPFLYATLNCLAL